MELRTVAVCIIGGVSLYGSSGSVVGTLIGCVFPTVVENGTIVVHSSGYWQQAAVGPIIAIVIDLLRNGNLFRKEWRPVGELPGRARGEE